METYDYIITGAGCAGLSLAMRMIRQKEFAGKRILLIDKRAEKSNDRTWCFWETGEDLFEPVVYHRWKKAWFYGSKWHSCMDLSPYTYKMIRGIDFYRYCTERLREMPNVNWLEEEVKTITNTNSAAEVITANGTYQAGWIFNSILFDRPVLKKGQYYLLQHFKGWIINTNRPVFNPLEATLMDFRPHQHYGTTFVYIMPFSENRALVEFTLFSETVLPDSVYDNGLRDYMDRYFNQTGYTIEEEEVGTIPMTNFDFPRRIGRICQMGTAGGQTKPSSGYTFRFIQKHTAQILRSLGQHGHPFATVQKGRKRFHWYDSILLQILSKRELEGRTIFEQLFQKNEPARIMKFLDNETTVSEELRVLNSLPKWPFMKAGWQQILK